MSDTIFLKSNENKYFKVNKKNLTCSTYLETLCDIDDNVNFIFINIDTDTLKHLIKFFNYNNKNPLKIDNLNSYKLHYNIKKCKIQKWYIFYFLNIDMVKYLKLLNIVMFLNIPNLYELMCIYLSHSIYGKNQEDLNENITVNSI
tara:strand:- start:3205 stop:3639 length:435 start_codon:yes stop_codon:yes gene_type:complete